MPGLNLNFPMTSKRHQSALITAIGESSGIWPTHKRDSQSAYRVMYPPAQSRSILNVTEPIILAKIGNPSGAICLEVNDPSEAATHAKAAFERYGYNAHADSNVEPEMPPGFMVFLIIEEIPDIILVFWPKNPLKEDLEKIPAAEVWTSDDLVQP